MRALHYVEGPSKLTLFTVQATRNGNGAHTGLMVSDTHRALFDPAGTFYFPGAPERNDVHFGMTDVVIQEVEVSPEVARQAMQLIQSYGAVPKAQCGLSTSRILSQLPGFESIPVTWSPNRISQAFGELPGATYRRVTDSDADTNHGVLFEASKEFKGQDPLAE